VKVCSTEAVGEHPEAFGERAEGKVCGPETVGEHPEAAGGAPEAVGGGIGGFLRGSTARTSFVSMFWFIISTSNRLWKYEPLLLSSVTIHKTNQFVNT
jgi:hypothetical protein